MVAAPLPTSEPRVLLRPITPARLEACLALTLPEHQRGWVAPNVFSLAQACTDPCLHPRGVYDLGEWIDAPDREPTMKGFVMYEVKDGAGFIMRVMIDQAFHRRGYGRGTIAEVIRSLRLIPEVRVIAVSHRSDNQPAAGLYASLGFSPWTPSGSPGKKDETYLFLDPQSASVMAKERDDAAQR